MTTPFWEASYRRPDRIDTFGGGKPSTEVVTVAGMLSPGSHALDVGSGEGRNALYLATLGHQVHAIDVSESGITKLRKTATARGLSVQASIQDMRTYKPAISFGLVVCLGCLHLIKREEWQVVIKQMKAATSPGGYHVVGAFTDTVPEPEDQRGLMVGLFREHELLEQYSDWEVLDHHSVIFAHQHPDGPRHKHAADELIARKPENSARPGAPVRM